MRSSLGIIAALALITTGCLESDPPIASYTSNSSILERVLLCYHSETINDRDLRFEYRVTTVDSSNRRIYCAAGEGSRFSTSHSDSDLTSAVDHACAVPFDLDGTGTGSWNFSDASGKKAVYSQPGSPFHGQEVTFMQCD